MELTIIPQKFSFSQPTVHSPSTCDTPIYGMSVTVEIDVERANKKVVKENLQSIFAQVLEYFDEP